MKIRSLLFVLIAALMSMMSCKTHHAVTYNSEKYVPTVGVNVCCELKPRLVVLTDIGPADLEPDDNESAVRLMCYADMFEIEAICTSTGWNCDPYPESSAEYLYAVIDAYEKDVENLMRRSYQKDFKPLDEENLKQEMGYWPSAEYLRSRAMMGSKRAGMCVIGDDNDSPGSEMLIRLADEDDPRPIYVTAWGGANTLSQAIWRVQQTRSPEELKKFLRKFRLYTITDQDMVWAQRMDRAYSLHQWLRREFSDDLMLVWDESAWLNQNALGKDNWNKYAEQIQTRGNLGKVYPKYLWGVEGDTPSFLNCLPTGLNDPNDPTQVGWGGVHDYGISPDSITCAWTNWQQPLKDISDSYERRFYPDEFNDFAARMEWADAGNGNRNPKAIVTVKWSDKEISNWMSYAPIYISGVADGELIHLDASKSYDPDNESISILWWTQGENGLEELDRGTLLTLKYHKPITVVCEIRDNGPYNLVAYKRVVISK